MTPEFIIIHHSAGEDTPQYSWPGIKAYHLSLGWRDIGYHAGIELVGGEYMIQLGRLWDETGAHALDGYNAKSLGFCFVGDYNSVAPDRKMLIEAARFLRFWQRLYRISAAHVRPHRAVNQTDCPGRLFDMGRLLDYLEA